MTQTTYRTPRLLILGLEDRYVNELTGAWQEKHPFLTETERQSRSRKTEQMRTQIQICIIAVTSHTEVHSRPVTCPQSSKTWEEKAECMRKTITGIL